MRLVSQEMNTTIEANKNAPANFGLIFNKWLVFDGCEPIVNRNKQPLIDSYEKSSKNAEEVLKQRHLQQAEYCQAMEKAGWRSFIFHARLISPFVSGLGMAHPTETGMVLDHTSGMPYIPAAGQKGVLRLAHVINSLLDDAGNWIELDKLLVQGIVKERLDKGVKQIEWQEDKESKTLFGFSEGNSSLAGQLVVLDSYPLAPPPLGEEILNPHFKEYYGGNRGPTEDQSPNPVKFLVVKSGAEFVFRLLLRQPLDNAIENIQEFLAKLVGKNLRSAISDQGLGAKTALGFGRFEVIALGEPATVRGWLSKWQEEQERKKYPWRPTVRKIEQAGDWNQLNQLLDKNDIKERYQLQSEIGQAVREAAKRIRQAKPESWKEDKNCKRDEKLTEWLRASGTTWAVLTEDPHTLPPPIDPAEQAAKEKIQNLKGWSKEISKEFMDELPLVALYDLRNRMKNDWGCDEKRAKPEKKRTWKDITDCIKKKKQVDKILQAQGKL